MYFTDLLSKLELEDSISFFGGHSESSFLAIALDNYDISIIDMDTRTVVRKFSGHRGPLTDLTFSPDSRWLVTSAMDSTIRTWDIPSSSMIDILKVSLCELFKIKHINFINMTIICFRLMHLAFH